MITQQHGFVRLAMLLLIGKNKDHQKIDDCNLGSFFNKCHLTPPQRAPTTSKLFSASLQPIDINSNHLFLAYLRYTVNGREIITQSNHKQKDGVNRKV